MTVTGIDTTTPPPDDAFVTTWEVETSPYVIHMPVEIRSGATATIDWGDGNSTDCEHATARRLTRTPTPAIIRSPSPAGLGESTSLTLQAKKNSYP